MLIDLYFAGVIALISLAVAGITCTAIVLRDKLLERNRQIACDQAVMETLAWQEHARRECEKEAAIATKISLHRDAAYYAAITGDEHPC